MLHKLFEAFSDVQAKAATALGDAGTLPLLSSRSSVRSLS